MTHGERSLVRISAALASRDEAALTSAFEEASGVADNRQVEEVLLQSYLFLGFPASLNGMTAWRRFSDTVPSAPQELDCVGWADRGHEVCGSVYAGQYEKLRETVRALHPDLEQWMVVEGYGKVLGRPGLPLTTRELCIVASLAVLGNLERANLYIVPLDHQRRWCRYHHLFADFLRGRLEQEQPDAFP